MSYYPPPYALQELQPPFAGMSTAHAGAKRKSDASMGEEDDDYVPSSSKPATKKPRASKAKATVDPHAQAKQLVQAIVGNPNGFVLPPDQAAIRGQLVLIAQYASALSVGDAAGAEGTRIVKAMSEDKLDEAADKLARAALSQIKKQMVWKPSCKAGNAKWMYQAVFQRFMQLPELPKYKAAKITLEQLYNILDTRYIETSIRYGSLRITSPNINVKWNKDSGEFSLSGTGYVTCARNQVLDRDWTSMVPLHAAAFLPPPSPNRNMRIHTPQPPEESWADAESFSDDEASPSNGQGWRYIDPDSGSRVVSRSLSVRSRRSSLGEGQSQRDLKITFESEDGQRTWVESANLFTEDSPLFMELVDQDKRAEVFIPDPITKLPGLRRPLVRRSIKGSITRLKYNLEGVTPFDFESLLAGLRPKLGQEIPYERLCPLLVLATDWGFESIRNYAIAALSKHSDPPVPRILLARRAKVSQWLLDAYVALSTRITPLTKFEASALGMESVLKVSDARGKVLERRLSLIAGPRPGTFLGKWTFFHGGCWVVASAAWRKALTEEKYQKPTGSGGSRSVGPVQAMDAALKDMARDGRGLCLECRRRKGIAEWLDLGADEALARKLFKYVTGEEVEVWVR
ncbi:hypothetical protein FRB90_012189 [Tulasnella sp. 427]|nr:hypothetical protein FRB90_012189 [Tulasnella sp. 427]